MVAYRRRHPALFLVTDLFVETFYISCMQFDASNTVLLDSNIAVEDLASLESQPRLAAIRGLDVLDEPVERNFQMLAELANKLLGTPVSLITLVTDDRQFFVSSDGLKEPWSERRETPLSHSFCQYVVRRNEAVVICNSRKHPLLCENLAIEDLGVEAYLGVPLVHDDQVLGSFCVIDKTPRQWTKDDLDSVSQFASLAASELASRKAAKQKQFELESRLRQSQKMEAIGQLTTGVAHDFSNILWAIKLSAGLVHTNRNNAELTSAYADNIHASVDAAQGIVGQLLNWSRPGGYSAAEVSLTEIVSQALPLLRTSLSSSAEILFESTDEGRVFADANQIHQILLNLCSNSDHAMGAEGGDILISISTKELSNEIANDFGLEAGRYVEMCVADQGCGIPSELLHRIHDPYFTTKPIGEGTGLGLWTVFGIVRRHDGQLRVSSVPDTGTTFTILFPECTESEQNVSATAGSQDNHENVLVVVEDKDIASTLQKRLLATGVSTVTFNDSPGAFEYFIRNPARVDLLVADQSMPILSGSDLIQRCKLLKPSLPVVCVAERSDSCQAQESVVCGQEPVDCDELVGKVGQLLQQIE